MEDRTILEGCEVLCLGFESSDYVACPLPFEEQKVCKQRLQYQAGWTARGLLDLKMSYLMRGSGKPN